MAARKPRKKSSGTKTNALKKTSKKNWMDDLNKTELSNSIVAYFTKTDEPKNDNDIFCPHFWELKYANGCNFECQWCYLYGTFRYTGREKKLKDIEEIEKRLTALLDKAETPIMLNAGELSDALLYPTVLKRNIIPIFKKYKDSGHKLLLLTKTADSAFINSAAAQDIAVMAWSINAVRVSDQYEKFAPDPIQRLAASKLAHEIGYRTRLRLDPIVPVKGWKEAYTHIIKRIMEINPDAEMITLGTLRGLKSTILACKNNGNDMEWVSYLTEQSSWGLRTDQELCAQLYAHVISDLRKYGYKGKISLCKETLGVWKRLKTMKVIDYEPGDIACNCILQTTGEQENEQ